MCRQKTQPTSPEFPPSSFVALPSYLRMRCKTVTYMFEGLQVQRSPPKETCSARFTKPINQTIFFNRGARVCILFWNCGLWLFTGFVFRFNGGMAACLNLGLSTVSLLNCFLPNLFFIWFTIFGDHRIHTFFGVNFGFFILPFRWLSLFFPRSFCFRSRRLRICAFFTILFIGITTVRRILPTVILISKCV